MILHAADLKALATLKERQAEYNTELQEALSAKAKAEEAVRGKEELYHHHYSLSLLSSLSGLPLSSQRLSSLSGRRKLVFHLPSLSL